MKSLKFAKLKRRLTKHRSLVRTVLLTTLLAVIFFLLFATIRPALTLIKQLARGPAAVFSLVKDPERVLNSTGGRTNILLLGMGGVNHKGPQLTDSLILVSLDLASKDTVILSIPRDIWIDSLKTKINATYYYGEQKREGGGLVLAKAAVEEIIGQPVHYAITLDFEGFKQAIDLVGGIEVNVPESFDDYKYPIPGMEEAEPEALRYEHLHFDAGLQTLSGERALKYVRSRNAEGTQGTDFARSQRQQQVLAAFKDKVLSLETLLSPNRVSDLVKTFSGSIHTDLSQNEYLSLARLAFESRGGNLRQGILSIQAEDSGEGLLLNPDPSKYDGQWVLIGKDGNWDQVQAYVESLLFNAAYSTAE